MIRYFGIGLALVVGTSCAAKGEATPESETSVAADASSPSPIATGPGAFGDAAAPDAAAVCNETPLYGMSVDVVATSGGPPTPTGGVIGNGTYLLQAVEWYGPGAPSGSLATIGKLTLDITNDIANLNVNGARSTATFEATGTTSLAFTTTCSYGVRLPAAAQYSTKDGLTLFLIPDGAPNAVLVEHFGVFVNMR